MMIFACLVVVSLMMCNDFSRQGRLVAWRGRGLRGSVSEVWTAGHGGVNGRGRGRANLSLWALCVLLICVLCEKKNVFEIRWGVFSLTELTDLTEHFAHSFELIREWPLPQPLPRREGRDMWGYPYKTAIKGHNKTYILFIGVSRWLLPFPSGEGKGEGPLSLSCFLFSFSHRVTQKNRAYRVAQRH